MTPDDWQACKGCLGAWCHPGWLPGKYDELHEQGNNSNHDFRGLQLDCQCTWWTPFWSRWLCFLPWKRRKNPWLVSHCCFDIFKTHKMQCIVYLFLCSHRNSWQLSRTWFSSDRHWSYCQSVPLRTGQDGQWPRGMCKKEAASKLPPLFWDGKKASWIFVLCGKISGDTHQHSRLQI